MERWVPLFEIFLKSPSPETEASLWFQQALLNSSSSSTTTKAPITGSYFVSLLMKPCDVIGRNPSPTANKVMFIQTLPSMLQSRILSFLVFDHRKFCSSDLYGLAREILSGNEGADFWVKKGARNLLEKMSESNYESISRLNLDSAEERIDEEFESMPPWLRDKAGSNDLLLSWLPVSRDDLDLRMSLSDNEDGKDLMIEAGENVEEDPKEVSNGIKMDDFPVNVDLEPDVREMAANLRARVMNFKSTSELISLCNEIQKLCLFQGGDSFEILGWIEPWNADDETTSVLLSHLPNGSEEEELGWPSQVLCSVILPKFLVLEKPASRVLMSATIEFCKLHLRAAEYALIYPLMLRKDGINNSICEVITRVLKECLHSGHVSAFCQKLLCGGREENRFLCLPCHQFLISDELAWNDSLFNLFQNILNHNVPLTQDSVDRLVLRVRDLAETFPGSLKFGNFLLHLVTKCAPMLRVHKFLLISAVECTNSLVKKSILSKLAGL